MNESEEIRHCVELLLKGKVIIYPTDTIWGLGCDATNARAIDKLFKIKNRPENKSLIILVDSVERIKDYVCNVPPITADLIGAAKKPLSIIFDKGKNLAKNVSADETVCVRVVGDGFCGKLIKALGRPITSTSANMSGEPSPKTFGDISEKLKNASDYVVELYRDVAKSPKPSTIIRLHDNNEFDIIRS